jgi:hypothetical protein
MSPKIFGAGLCLFFYWRSKDRNTLTFRGTTLLTFRVRNRKPVGRAEKGYTERDCTSLETLFCAGGSDRSCLVVILQAQMRDQIFPTQVTQSVLELH